MIDQKKVLVIGPTFLDVQVFVQNITENQVNSNLSIGGKGYNVTQGVKLFKLPVILCTMYGAGEVGEYIAGKIKESGIESLESNELQQTGGIFVGVHDKHGDTIFDKADTGMFESQKLEGVDFSQISTILVLSSTNDTILQQLIKAKKDYPQINLCLEISGKKTITGVWPYLGYFDFIIANKIETVALMKTYYDKIENFEVSLNMLSRELACIFIATIDKDGVIVSESGKSTTLPIYFLPEPIVSTVGAGDSVTASIIALHYGYNKSLLESVEKAMIVASHTIRSKEPFLDKLPITI
ncbi:MAG: carbohydrate kinase family protein [Thermales bacterium]|nr:carbohydrate kinase family protein [Thermales bacterium]